MVCSVISFKEGSVQASVSTTFVRKSKVTPADVETLVNDFANSNHKGFTLPGMTYNFTKNATSKELDPCDEGIHDCDMMFGICSYTGKGSYSCTCKEGFVNRQGVAVDGVSCVPEDNSGLVIGVSIAAGLLLASIFICFIFCLKISLNGRGRVVKSYYPDTTSTSSDDHYGKQDETDIDDMDLERRMSRNAQRMQHIDHISPIPKATFDPLARPNSFIDTAEEALPQGDRYYGRNFHDRANNPGAVAY